jgi:hypothetical protein
VKETFWSVNFTFSLAATLKSNFSNFTHVTSIEAPPRQNWAK